MAKVTWKMIYDDCRQLYYRLQDKYCGFLPYDYATVLIFFKDGRRGVYNYDKKELWFVKTDLHLRVSEYIEKYRPRVND